MKITALLPIAFIPLLCWNSKVAGVLALGLGALMALLALLRGKL